MYFNFHSLEIDVIPVTILGGALAIFLGFRNNSSYDMWWEARKIWGGVVNISRTYAMEVMTLVSNKSQPAVTDENLHMLQRRIGLRHLAWINALRLQLRKQNSWEELKPYLEESEFEEMASYRNKATMLLHTQGQELRYAYDNGLITDFQYMDMVGRIKEMYDLQGKAERVKNTVFPYYYTYFTNLFLWLFVILLPLSLVHKLGWAVIPITTCISFVFLMLEKSGTVTEDPFENRAADTPMSSLCRTIEIDVRQQLGDTELPEGLAPIRLPYGVEYQS